MFKEEVYKITGLLATREITATEADNLICLAALAMGERMPKATGIWGGEQDLYDSASYFQLEKCQAHIREECHEM